MTCVDETFWPQGAAARRAAALEAHRLRGRTAPALRRRARHPQLRRVRRDRRPGLRHRQRLPVRQAHSRPGRSRGQQPENVKGVAASARTGRLYVSTIKRLGCIDLLTERCCGARSSRAAAIAWPSRRTGQILYVPSLEGPHWNVVDAHERRHHHEGGDRLGRPQHDLLAPRRSRLSRGPALAVAVGRRHEDAQGRQDRRPVRELHPSVHRERGPDALLRQRQRAARVRDRRSQDRARSCTAWRSRATRRVR